MDRKIKYKLILTGVYWIFLDFSCMMFLKFGGILVIDFMLLVLSYALADFTVKKLIR